MKNYIYTCGSYNIFPGFYESTLYNSDSEYYANEVLSENGESYELKDFEGFKNEVGRRCASLLFEALPLDCYDIIKNIEFDSIWSPRYYNFETDEILFKIDFDKRGLLRWIKERREAFNDYLKDHFTSRDGFWSFIENNFNDFMNQYKSEGRVGRCLNIMLDFYFLTVIDLKDFEMNLTEAADSIFYQYMELTTPEDSKNEK